MSYLRHVADIVSRLPPGHAVTLNRVDLELLGSEQMLGPLGPVWSPVDRIMECVVGSAYNIRPFESPATRDVTFYRLKEESEEPVWISPDRR